MQVCHILLLHIPYYFDEKKRFLPHFNKNKHLYQKKTLIPKKQTDEAFCDDITFHILQTPLFMMCTMQVVGFFLIQKK
jgi:hypothetical protein